MSSSGTSLRRSCQGCVKVKRRCDLLFPECTRCQKKGMRCSYTNIPLSNRSSLLSDGRVRKPMPTQQLQEQYHHHHHHASPTTKTRESEVALATKHAIRNNLQSSDSSDDNDSNHDSEQAFWIRPALDIEIRKYHTPYIVDLVTNVVRQAPKSFFHGESFFIHPCVYRKSFPRPVQEMHALCGMLTTNQSASPKLGTLLQRQIYWLLQSAEKATDFKDLVACVQALTLAQCMQLSAGNIHGSEVEKSLNALASLACKMWSMVPRELPSSMSPWNAWIFAETVRRTIVFSHLVIAAFQFLTRGYACRTPFIDALPFDGRTYLWDVRSEDEWARATSGSHLPMVSVIEYADLLQSGRALCFSSFEGLIIATCRGIELPIHDPSTMIKM